MRAAVFTEYGPPEVLRIQEIEKPVPADDELLVNVYATSVTAADYRVRGSNFPRLFWLPARIAFGLRKPKKMVLGSNFAGVVEATGSAVTRFKAGDSVFGSTGGKLGAYAEYVCLAEDATVAPKPETATYEEAAAIPFGAHTALSFLRDMGNIRSGQRVLIYGASGAVGTAAVQIAKYYGADVTGVSSTSNLEMVKSLGADAVIDYTREDFTANGQTYDIIFETVGKTSVRRGKRVLAKGGAYLVNLIGPEALGQMLWAQVARNKKVAGGIASERQADLVLIGELMDAGALKAVIDRTYSLEQIAEAHRYADTGRKKGNVVITLEHESA